MNIFDYKMYTKCDKCGEKTGLVNTKMCYMSDPPKYKYVCETCGNVGFTTPYLCFNK